MPIHILQNQDWPAYQHYIQQHPQANSYHTLAWQQVIAKTYRYSPFYLISKCIDNQAINGVLPLFEVNTLLKGKRLVAMPFSHKVPILYDNEQILVDLLHVAKQHFNSLQAKYILLKHGTDLPKSHNLQAHHAYYLTIIDLQEKKFETIYKNFSSSAKRAIKKARKSGVTVRVCKDINSYHVFHNMMIETRKRQGSPAYDFSLFKNIFYLLKPDNQRLYMASYQGIFIAGILMLYHNGRAIYAYGASQNAPELMRLRPNNLLFWQAIQDSCKQGDKEFDFGITPLHHEGLLRFKNLWGSESKIIPYYYLLPKGKAIPAIKRDGKMVQLISKLITQSPEWILREFSPQLLRQLG